MDLLDRVAIGFGPLTRPSTSELAAAWRTVGATVDELSEHAGEPTVYPYGRRKLFASDEVEVMVMNWAARRPCAPHDHGTSYGWVLVAEGSLEQTVYRLDHQGVPVAGGTRRVDAGGHCVVRVGMVHSMVNPIDGPTITVHLYAPPITGMKVYDLDRCAACIVSDDCGAWWPADQRQLLAEIRLGGAVAGATP